MLSRGEDVAASNLPKRPSNLECSREGFFKRLLRRSNISMTEKSWPSTGERLTGAAAGRPAGIAKLEPSH
jgi:hypothetical protein